MDNQYPISSDLWLFIRLAVSCYFFSIIFCKCLDIVAQFCLSQDTQTAKAAGFDLGFKQVTLSQIGATAMCLCCRWVISLEFKGCLFLTVTLMTSVSQWQNGAL